VQPTEDDTYLALRRTSYEEVWTQCRRWRDVEPTEVRVAAIRDTKRKCGWAEEDFKEQWDHRGQWNECLPSNKKNV